MKESERGREKQNKTHLSQIKQKRKAEELQKTHWDEEGDTELSSEQTEPGRAKRRV